MKYQSEHSIPYFKTVKGFLFRELFPELVETIEGRFAELNRQELIPKLLKMVVPFMAIVGNRLNFSLVVYPHTSRFEVSDSFQIKDRDELIRVPFAGGYVYLYVDDMNNITCTYFVDLPHLWEIISSVELDGTKLGIAELPPRVIPFDLQ